MTKSEGIGHPLKLGLLRTLVHRVVRLFKFDARSVREAFAPVYHGYEGEEHIVMLPVAKIPFVEPKIIISLREPVSTPDTLMLVFRLVCAAWIVGLKLVAWTVLGSKCLPTPAICEVHFWIGNLQHHCEWESRQQKTSFFVRAQSFIRIIVLRCPIRFVGR